MHHEMPEPKCGECGKRNTEVFHQKRRSGIRCLNCGHEHITEDRSRSPGGIGGVTAMRQYLYHPNDRTF